jgi:hypothetical protein
LRAAAVVAGEVHVGDLFVFGVDACALQVVPARSAALVLVAALNPEGIRDDLAADALVLFLILYLPALFLGSFSIVTLDLLFP